MPDREPIETTNLSRYGDDPLPWSRPRDLLVSGPPQPGNTFFLATTRPDGRPHMAGIGVHWYDGNFYFTSGPGTRKSKDLASDPRCSIAICMKGFDLVLDGEASRVDDPDLVAAVVERFREGGWPAEVEGSRIVGPYSAPSAGPPPWDVYRFRFDTALGVASEEPHGATRWRFG